MEIASEAIAVVAVLGIKLLIPAGCGICIAAEKINAGLKRHTTRKTVQRLLALPPTALRPGWHLPAPESYLLFAGKNNTRDLPFKAGILQLLAERSLTLEVFIGEPYKTLKYGGGGETILGRGTASTDRLKGSLAAIYRLWEYSPQPRTISSLANQARQEYGCLEYFTEIEVKPRLAEAKLSTGYPLSLRGHDLRDQLESNMAAVLRELKQERSSWIDQKPQQALLGAVVAVAAGRRKPAEETEMEIIAREVEPGTALALTTPENAAPDYYQPVWIDWSIFDNLESAYTSIDTGGAVNEQSGDGNAGEGGDGGGDCGGGGDWG